MNWGRGYSIIVLQGRRGLTRSNYPIYNGGQAVEQRHWIHSHSDGARDKLIVSASLPEDVKVFQHN